MSLLKKISNSYSSNVLLMIRFLVGNLFTTSFSAGNSNSDTLALVGKKAITVEDFINSYKDKLTKIGLTDNGETRISYLINLVNDELLISEARNRKLDKTAAAKKEFKSFCKYKTQLK